MPAHAKSAAVAIRKHVAQCGTKGNKTPSKSSSRRESDVVTRVGGVTGSAFSNDIGRR